MLSASSTLKKSSGDFGSDPSMSLMLTATFDSWAAPTVLTE
jgi:hypothetical protein